MVSGLEGIKVIETASVFAGPIAGRMLADWGADVIHIESPIIGSDLARRQGTTVGSRVVPQNFNRNKRGITLNLSQDSGLKILYGLLAKADVLLCNYRPRELKKFRLEYATLSRLNPGLILANVTGYGKTGPDKNQPGFDFTAYFPRSGLLQRLQVPGIPPPQSPMGVGDNMAGLALALGIMTALFIRSQTGKGQEVDVSLFQTGVFAISYDIACALVAGQDEQPVERENLANAVNTCYQTQDGRWLRLGLSRPDQYWAAFCRAIGRQDLANDPRFTAFQPRTENHAALFHILEEVFLTKPLDEWQVRLTEAGLPWAPVQSLSEVIADPQARANDFFVTYDHPTHGRLELVANPVKLSQTPATVRMPAPELGQHTEEVLLEYGYTWQDIERFKEQGVIA
ncbi:MAG: CoA transferase [Chloroflexi bacterium]|nr:CoA transferase [Chloroflexota bacterium]